MGGRNTPGRTSICGLVVAREKVACMPQALRERWSLGEERRGELSKMELE